LNAYSDVGDIGLESGLIYVGERWHPCNAYSWWDTPSDADRYRSDYTVNPALVCFSTPESVLWTRSSIHLADHGPIHVHVDWTCHCIVLDRRITTAVGHTTLVNPLFQHIPGQQFSYLIDKHSFSCYG